MRHEALIGTYTRRGAEGIYRGAFDDETGAFETLELAVATVNPAFLIARGGCVYAVNEQTEGGVSAFRRRGASLALVDWLPSGGIYPCHLSVGPGWVAVANYGTGNVSLFPTDGAGRLLPMADMRQREGSGR